MSKAALELTTEQKRKNRGGNKGRVVINDELEGWYMEVHCMVSSPNWQIENYFHSNKFL